MYTRASIRRHINSIPAGKSFSTRDFLNYGLRAAVDQTLYVMVKAEEIVRVARGIFIKPPKGRCELPSAMEIAATKAKAFGKQIYTHGRDAAKAMKLVESGNGEPTFTTNGRSTSFFSIHGRIYFKGTNAKDITKANSRVGLIIRALKQVGRYALDRSALAKVMDGLARSDRNELRQSMNWMPSWMSDAFMRSW
jgi:hypothetical protein